MGSINPSSSQKTFQDSYSYKSGSTYKYRNQSPLGETGTADTIHTGNSGLLLLINPAYYFLECVYILYQKGYYRLVVLHNNRVLTYRNYRTLRGAKIAFQKIYKDKAWKEGVKASWTPPYVDNYGLVKEKDTTAADEPLKAYSI
jgi:hypothetical protein